MNVTVLVDFANDSVQTALEVADALGTTSGASGSTRPTSWSTRALSAHGDDAPTGVNAELVRLVRSELDAHGFARRPDRRRPAASRPTGSASSRPRGVPVDAYGVGSSLIRGSNDFTADVVMADGRPAGKVGRELRPNPRLRPV